jgi:hypothetical protein
MQRSVDPMYRIDTSDDMRQDACCASGAEAACRVTGFGGVADDDSSRLHPAPWLETIPTPDHVPQAGRRVGPPAQLPEIQKHHEFITGQLKAGVTVKTIRQRLADEHQLAARMRR